MEDRSVHIRLPMSREEARQLKAGDRVLLTGDVYTARDAAHQRLLRLLDEGKELPFPLEDAVIYYVGPTPAPPGRPIGSAGPTTSYRMDAYAPTLLKLGLRGMIGKGRRSPEVMEAMMANDAVYFAAVGGAAALLATRIRAAELIAFEDLGAEAIRRLTLDEFPVLVAADCRGNDLYELGPKAWLEGEVQGEAATK